MEHGAEIFALAVRTLSPAREITGLPQPAQTYRFELLSDPS